ncbi:MAG: aminodeoxychorismate synthase component I [Alphaproteobacteria bacterium]
MTPRQPLMREIAPITPANALRAFEGLPCLAFLDSGSNPSELARWSFVAADPFARFEIRNGQAFWQNEPIAGDALTLFKDKVSGFTLDPLKDGPPLTSGAIGFLAYELGSHFESIPSMPKSRENEAELSFGFYDVVFAHDALTKKSFLISSGFPELDERRRLSRAQERIQLFEDKLNTPPRALKNNPPVKDWHSNFTKDDYETAVSEVIDAILRGDIFQANLSHCFTASRPPYYNPLAFYLALRAVSPAPFGAYIEGETITYASNSPERYVKLEPNGMIEARPIKGTARRSSDPTEDRALAHTLLESEKDRAENIMIVDLLRNDLSRVAKTGSVRVPTLCGLETYANVHHLVSVIEATLKPEHDLFDLIRATFPGGSITGAPKIKAMDVIATQEKTPRGVYCGAMGYISFDGTMDLNIAIRTATFTQDEIRFSAGGGITALSDPESEYRETLVKAERLFKAFRHEEGE